MEEIFVTPLLLGLSLGIYCFIYCIPFIAPFIVSEKRKSREDINVILKFIFGRFIGYIAFGAVFGYLGEKISSMTLNVVLNAAMMLLSIILVLHVLGLAKSLRFSWCIKIKKHNSKLPVLMGFLMGINVCPPFLMSLTYVFTLHSMLKGIIYFIMFFIGTTLYFLPLVFLGHLNKLKEFQKVGRISGLIVGTLLFFYGFYRIIKIFL